MTLLQEACNNDVGFVDFGGAGCVQNLTSHAIGIGKARLDPLRGARGHEHQNDLYVIN